MSLPIIDSSAIFRKKPLTAIILYAAGLGEFVEAEIQSILNDPWIPEKKSTEKAIIQRYKEKIILRKISLQSLLGLSVRSYHIRDIYILLKESSSITKDFSLSNFLSLAQTQVSTEKSPSLKVQIRKNEKIIEKNILEDWNRQFPLTKEDCPSTNRYLLDIYENHISFYKSLRDRPIYQRGYRIPFSHSAPLTEDVACILLSSVLKQVYNSYPNPRIKAFVPFSGTGTIGFELYSLFNSIPPNIFKTSNESSIEYFHGSDWFQFLNKKSRSLIQKNDIVISCYDNYLPVVESSKVNLANFIEAIKPNNENPSISIEPGDYWDKELIASPEEFDIILLPLNPPYGIRFQNKISNTEFYQKISAKIVKYAENQGSLPIYGFILCPDESSYFSALGVLSRAFHCNTHHFSQGSLSLRVVFFSPNL